MGGNKTLYIKDEIIHKVNLIFDLRLWSQHCINFCLSIIHWIVFLSCRKRSRVYSLPLYETTFLAWLVGCMVVLRFQEFQLYGDVQCTYPCFPGVFSTGTPHNILSKPLPSFPQNHCRNNRQRKKSCRNDYHQSSKKNIGRAGDRISDLLSSRPKRYWLTHGARHDIFRQVQIESIM